MGLVEWWVLAVASERRGWPNNVRAEIGGTLLDWSDCKVNFVSSGGPRPDLPILGRRSHLRATAARDPLSLRYAEQAF